MSEQRDDEQVGAYEAKTHLPRLLRKVIAGQRVRITQRGKPVADLVPVQAPATLGPVDAARRMRSFAEGRKDRPKVAIRELIDEGRD